MISSDCRTLSESALALRKSIRISCHFCCEPFCASSSAGDIWAGTSTRPCGAAGAGAGGGSGADVTGVTGMAGMEDRKSTRLNSSHQIISYAVFCLKKKKKKNILFSSAVVCVLQLIESVSK